MLSIPEKASELLTQYGGRREAEAAAWAERERYGGPDNEGYKFFTQVALAIAFGRERK